MGIFPLRRAAPTPPALPSTRDAPSTPDILEAARPSPFEWARRRRAEREARRAEAAGARALNRLDHLGPHWHVVEWPRTDPASTLLDIDPYGREPRAGFLAIGPGGLYAITIVDHGRSRVLIAGDVVQINGKRPPYVAEAQRDARRASKALSAAIGLKVPVQPVLTFVGSGVISVYGLPEKCLVATHRELDRLLLAGGNRISATTASKLAQVARHPATWLNAPYRAGAEYRWYQDGRTAADNKATHR